MRRKGADRPPRGLSIPLKQFQEKWKDFRSKYDTNEKCIEALLEWGNFDTTNCRECGAKEVDREPGSKIVKCRLCRVQIDVFDDTLFQGIEKPLAYLAALWLKKEQIEMSANLLASYAGVASSTAQGILKKLDTVILDDFMSSTGELHSSLFIEIFAKRSSETPARQQPSEEQTAFDQLHKEKKKAGKQSDHGSSSAEPSPNEESSYKEPNDEELDDSAFEFNGTTFDIDLQRKVYNAVPDKPINIDELIVLTGIPDIGGILTWLQLAQLIQPTGGGLWQRVKKVVGLGKHFQIDKVKLEQFLDYVRHVFHGISRKHLQKFLARYFAFICNKFSGSNLLAQACARHSYISQDAIRSFVTPALVKAALS